MAEAPLEDILFEIGRRLEAFRQELAEFLSIPSISATGQGVEEAARWVAGSLERKGFSPELVPSPTGRPAVLAEMPGPGKRVLYYNHYDVQPPDPLELWESPPFEPSFRAGRLYARGVADDKADFLSRLHALDAYVAARGKPRLHLLFLVEGEEEIGSPGLGSVVESLRQRLGADGCVWEAAGLGPDGRPRAVFGCKGLLYVEVRLRRLPADRHSSYATVFPSAAWELVQALSSLRGEDGRVQLPGFHDRVRPPSEAELAYLEALPFEEARELEEAGAEATSPKDLKRRHLYEPTCNIAGLEAGYTGPGPKTVLPAEARVKLDFRLVPDQDPKEVFSSFKEFLAKRGLGDAEVVLHSAERPSQSPVDSWLGRAVVEVARERFGADPAVYPRMAATGPMAHFQEDLGIPVASPPGPGRPDSNIHAPNENILFDDYLAAIAYHAALLARLESA